VTKKGSILAPKNDGYLTSRKKQEYAKA